MRLMDNGCADEALECPAANAFRTARHNVTFRLAVTL
jgi:hypothetical protein